MLPELYDKLSKREEEVLLEVVKGKLCKQIADTLCVSERTIETHKASLFIKTGSFNAVQLTVWAFDNRYIKPKDRGVFAEFAR